MSIRGNPNPPFNMLFVLEIIELSDFIPGVKIMSYFGRETVFKTTRQI